MKLLKNSNEFSTDVLAPESHRNESKSEIQKIYAYYLY